MAESFHASVAANDCISIDANNEGQNNTLLSSQLLVAPRKAISQLNNSVQSNTEYSSNGISVSAENSQGNFTSITFEIPRTIEGTTFPTLPPEAITAVEKKVEQQFYCLIRKKGDQISTKRFDDTIFHVSTKDKSCAIMHPPEKIIIVTLNGTLEMVEFGQKCVKNFILQSKVWRNLLLMTELDASSRYDISVQVSLAVCPLQTQIKMEDLDEYYVNLRRTTGVWVSSLMIGTEIHFILGDLLSEKGACLLKINGFGVQSSNDVKVACDKATITGNDAVMATFRFPIGVNLSMIRGEYVIEKPNYDKKGNDGGSPLPPIDIDDQPSAYSSFIAKFKAVPTIEFHGLCAASVKTSMWQRHKLIYGPSCDSECPCASNLISICDTVRSDFRNSNAPETAKVLEKKVGFLDYFYKFYYPEVASQFPFLRPQEVFDKVVALWCIHLENPLHGPLCHVKCPCLDANLLRMQQKKQQHLVRLAQTKVRPVLRNPKYSIVSDAAARCSGKNLNAVISKKLENNHSKEKENKLVHFQRIEGDDEASLPRGCVTQIDSTLITDSSEHFDEDLNADKYSISNFFSRRQNSEIWRETKEQKYTMQDTHVWNPIEESGFACSKCRISKGKFFSCKLCGTCLSCGSKSPCEDSESSRPIRGKLTSFNLAHLLRRRYEEALLAAFGFGLVKTVALRDLLDITVEKDADIYKVKSNEMSYCQDFFRAIELIELEPSFINLPLSSSLAEGDHAALPRELIGRSILFAAAMYSTHKSVLYLLKRGSDARLRDHSNKRASDVLKERRQNLIDRMKQIRNAKVMPDLVEEEMLKAEIKDVETTSNVIQVYMAGERLLNLSSGVKSWSLVQVKILQATNLQFSPQISDFSSPDLLFCVPTWDGRQLNHITTVEPLSQNPDWSKSIPYQLRFSDEVSSSYTGKTLLVQLIKGDPISSDNFLLSTWQSTGEELNQIANSEPTKGVFPLPASQFLESGYVSIEIRRLPCDSTYEEKVKKSQGNELSRLIGLVEGLKSKSVDLPSNLNIPTADNLSFLHAAIYLENIELVKTLLNLGASVTSGAPGRSPMDLCKSLNDKCPNKYNEEILIALRSHVTSIMPSAENIDKTAYHSACGSNVKNESTPIKNSSLPGVSAKLGSSKKSIPMLKNTHWMLEKVKKRQTCRYFNSTHGCHKKAICHFAHVYVSQGSKKISFSSALEKLSIVYDEFFKTKLRLSAFYETTESDEEGKIWFAGGFCCPVESTIYYALGGLNGQVNQQCLFLYPSIEDARAATAGVVLHALRGRGMVISEISPEKARNTTSRVLVCENRNTASFNESPTDGRHKRSLEIADDMQHTKKTCLDERSSGQDIMSPSNHLASLPLLPKVDWMLKYPKAKQCFDFERDHACKFGKHCRYGHVYRLNKNLLPFDNFKYSHVGKLYKAIFDADLTDSDILKKEDIAANGKSWFTGCMVCPDQTIYYAAGGKNGHRNSQGLYFYPSHEDMLDALAGVFLHVMGERAEILPSLQEPEWMLELVKAAQTCKYFPGCVRMENCRFAHIYRGGDPDPTQTVEYENLLKLYQLKFNQTIKNSDFYEKEALDKAGRRMYTGAFCCPAERTIYYARGMGGLVSAQNIYWYTSKNAAKNAVTAIVVSALVTEAPGARAVNLSKSHGSGLPEVPQDQVGGVSAKALSFSSSNAPRHSNNQWRREQSERGRCD